MARQDRSVREKQQMENHQRQVRRGQYLMAGFSVLIILSMLISLIRF